MTEECVEQQTSQDDVRTSGRGAAKQGRDYLSDDEDVMEEHQKISRMMGESLQAAYQEQLEPTGRKKPQLVRSKTLDNSMLTQVQIDPESKIDRKKSHYSQLSKSNSQYHKIFKEISKEEQLRQSYTCALQKDILYQGRMFVSDHWICFHSKVFGKDTKIAIPVMSITNIKKTKTAILLPNALVIATTNDRYVFVSFLSRDNTYKFLTSLCLHLEGRSPCSSPVPSSAPHSFRGQRSPLLTPFPMGDFVDLDGVVRQRRQELEENSSSDSPAPDYDKIAADLPIPHFLDALKQKGNSPSPEQKHKVKKQHQNQQSGTKKSQNSLRSSSEVVFDSRVMKTVSLNTLLIIYMFLVCVLVLSSCYLAFRIVSLEQKLTTLGSISDFTHHDSFLPGSPDVNTELFSELLAINLLKLEKVQKNLQRLLEEAA
ncbi:PREDICTED: GRAM domain-containing protein 3 isoform X3 [Poecilia mexicana]|uniref:GRAM domain-containing protein 3 isoform X3 n=1 Tax=Poecilia mexicana TaxID=48701 RepID=UPI00072E80B1|nr:PREDICTED: GRAM domain-containing protein 3 isoform X3 [Poecilia mexicana]